MFKKIFTLLVLTLSLLGFAQTASAGPSGLYHSSWTSDPYWLYNQPGNALQSGRFAVTMLINDANTGNYQYSGINPETYANDVWLGDNATPAQVVAELQYWGFNPQLSTITSDDTLERGDLVYVDDANGNWGWVMVTSEVLKKFPYMYVGTNKPLGIFYYPGSGEFYQGEFPWWTGYTVIRML